MGYVGKWASVHKCGIVFDGLHQIGLQGVFEQYGDSACHAQVIDGEGRALVGVAQDYVTHAAAQVVNIVSQAHYRHYFACRSDVEARLARHTVHAVAQAGHHIAQIAVVHVEHAFPGHLA